jgi:subtilisin family serine protease
MNEELPPGSGIPAFAYDLVFNTIFDASGGGVSAAWGWKAGTSMSAPNVAGVAALLREQFPDAPAHQIQRLLKEHAQNVGNQELHGNGHVGMMEALNATDPSDQRPGRNPREGGRDDSGRDDSSDGDGSGDGGESGRGGDDDGGDDRGR